MKLILLGKPGAGKGTQAKKIADYYNIPHISTGEMFRQAYAGKTELGVLAHDKYWGKGHLVPDDITLKLVEERLAKGDCKKGFILDGFPRTLVQAKALDKNNTIDHVLYIETPDSLCIQRIAGRRNCSQCAKDYNIYFNPPKKDTLCDTCNQQLVQRPDDKEDIVKQRIIVYENQTQPLIAYYQNNIVTVTDNGNDSPDKLFQKIKKALGK